MYAVREIIRRAGVCEELFKSWKIDIETDWTIIHLGNGVTKSLRFRNATFRETSPFNQSFEVARASWTFAPRERLRRLVPYFTIPFSNGHNDTVIPLFRKVDGGLECDFDLPLSALLTLSRFEEYQSAVRDEHGRFLGSQSLAFREGFLMRPIVDEFGLAIEQALLSLLPGWQPEPRRLRAKLSHDIDLIGMPFNLRTTLGHIFRRRKPSAAIRDLVAEITNTRPAYLALVQKIAQMSLDRGLDSAIYWKAGGKSPHDTGYDPCERKVAQMIDWLNGHNVECGVHPGYETFCCLDRLLQEAQIVRKAIGEEFIGGRQHYLRWKPETWLDWEACGLAYDSSVGFADRVGFRAGTCFPYRPWILSANREAKILEIPLIVMDCVPVVYMGLSLEKSFEIIEECVSRCRLVGGVFTLLWHNSSLIDPVYGDLYPAILDRLAGCDRFDWIAASKEWQSTGPAQETQGRRHHKHQQAYATS